MFKKPELKILHRYVTQLNVGNPYVVQISPHYHTKDSFIANAAFSCSLNVPVPDLGSHSSNFQIEHKVRMLGQHGRRKEVALHFIAQGI